MLASFSRVICASVTSAVPLITWMAFSSAPVEAISPVKRASASTVFTASYASGAPLMPPPMPPGAPPMPTSGLSGGFSMPSGSSGGFSMPSGLSGGFSIPSGNSSPSGISGNCAACPCCASAFSAIAGMPAASIATASSKAIAR